MTPVKAAQVVAGLTAAGYRCGADGPYATCTLGSAAVWILTGTHERPPVLSVHSAGPVATAAAEIAKVLPQALEIAGIGPGPEIVSWFGTQQNQATAQEVFGDWQVDYTTEVDTEEPGAHLTVSDKLCKVNCRAE